MANDLRLKPLSFIYGQKGNLNPMTSRKYINIVDGVISGEGEGPMCVSEKYTNLLIHTHNPLVADAIAAQLMGYDLRHMKLLVEGVKNIVLTYCQT